MARKVRPLARGTEGAIAAIYPLPLPTLDRGYRILARCVMRQSPFSMSLANMPLADQCTPHT